MGTVVTTWRDGQVARVTLNQAKVPNTFSGDVIRKLKEAFDALSGEARTLVMVLAGKGLSLSVGADRDWMHLMGEEGREGVAEFLEKRLPSLSTQPGR